MNEQKKPFLSFTKKPVYEWAASGLGMPGQDGNADMHSMISYLISIKKNTKDGFVLDNKDACIDYALRNTFGEEYKKYRDEIEENQAQQDKLKAQARLEVNRLGEKYTKMLGGKAVALMGRHDDQRFSCQYNTYAIVNKEKVITPQEIFFEELAREGVVEQLLAGQYSPDKMTYKQFQNKTDGEVKLDKVNEELEKQL